MANETDETELAERAEREVTGSQTQMKSIMPRRGTRLVTNDMEKTICVP